MEQRLNTTRNLTGLFIAAMLAGCGSGGDAPNTPGAGSPAPAPAPQPPSPPAPNPAAQLLPPQTTVPNPTYGDPVKMGAFNQLNAYRALAGLGLVRQDALVDAAAQAHASWQTVNNAASHFETQGTPGFTGVTVADRLLAQGYQASLNSEGFGYNWHADVRANGTAAGIAVAERLTDTIYHRSIILEPAVVDVGIGHGDANQVAWVPLVIDMASPSAAPGGQALPAASRAVVWPVDGAANVKLLMGNESPNPVPSQTVTALGYPASLHCHITSRLTVSSFTMTDTASGASIDAVVLVRGQDPNNVLGECVAGLVPRAALAPSTTYRVNFAGDIDGQAYTRVWTFTTASQ